MARVSVIGLGKLGAPLAAVLSIRGHKVTGLDLNEETVESINAGKAPVPEPGLQELIDAAPFKATTDWHKAVSQSDITFIIVPTPSDAFGRFKNEYVLDAVTRVGEEMAKKVRYHVVVVCSTVMPGSTDGPIRQTLVKTLGDKEFGLCYSPEFIALGSVVKDMLNPDMILIGESDKKAGDVLAGVLSTVSDAPVHRMNLVNAEIAKISVNTFITMKIAYANQMAEICEGLPGANADIVTQAVGADSRIGTKYLKPGTAYGGPCFPRDTKAFAALGHQTGTDCFLAEATDKVNHRQISRLISFAEQLSTDPTRSKTSKMGVLGLSYKPGTPVTEESPGVRVAQALGRAGWPVRVFDPLVCSGQADCAATHAASATELIEEVSVLFIMTASEEYKSLFPRGFERNPGLKVVDCWNVIPPGPWDETNVLRLGVGQ